MIQFYVSLDLGVQFLTSKLINTPTNDEWPKNIFTASSYTPFFL